MVYTGFGLLRMDWLLFGLEWCHKVVGLWVIECWYHLVVLRHVISTTSMVGYVGDTCGADVGLGACGGDHSTTLVVGGLRFPLGHCRKAAFHLGYDPLARVCRSVESGRGGRVHGVVLFGRKLLKESGGFFLRSLCESQLALGS
jgi:hypothetical protein